MKMIGATWAGFLLMLVLGACVPESRHPLSDPETSMIDQRLVGLWAGRIGDADAYVHFLPAGDNEMEIIAVSQAGDGRASWSVFSMFSSRIGDEWYMNVKGLLDDGEPWESGGGNLYLCRYRISAEGELSVWILNAKAAMAAIEGGLAGSVEKGFLSRRWRRPLRPSVVDPNKADTMGDAAHLGLKSKFLPGTTSQVSGQVVISIPP